MVPFYAKSAATMLSLAADRLLLDEHSELGPIDPQFTFPNGMTSPAKGILDQFERANEEIQTDQSRLPAWAPILQQYAPSLLQDASEAIDLSVQMVASWLERYMFRRRSNARENAIAVARFFADRDPSDRLISHSRAIGIDKCIELGLEVEDLRKNPGLQQRVRELHHAYDITFRETGAYKMFENHLGHALIQNANLQFAAEAEPRATPAEQVEKRSVN